jgi:N-acetylmuramoyl-L-alanine amidase
MSARRATLLLLALLGCASREPAAEPEAEGPRETLIPSAHRAMASLQRGEVPADLDRVVGALAARAHDLPARSAVAPLCMAGDLLAERHRLARAPQDLARALDYLRAASVDPTLPGACVALRHRADVLVRERDPRAEGAESQWETGCVPPAQRRARTTPAVTPGGRGPRRVVLDPGHGGSDPGAIGPSGLHEAEVNLDVARRVAARLAERYGVQVILTRDRDTYVPLEDRAAHANDAGVDLFVSIHCNAARNLEAHGIATFVLDTGSPRVANRVTMREGELVAGDPWGGGEVTRILADLRLTQHGGRSVRLAESIQRAMLHDARLLYPAVEDMGVHPAGFHVLVSARMPSVLVELSFISNAAEEQRLRGDAYRDVLASAIARAVGTFAP